MKKIIQSAEKAFYSAAAGLFVSLLFFSCASYDNSSGSSSASGEIADYVKTKYSNGTSDSNQSQSKWKMANCHDPKLFQDDDGTYYVYSTDASTGNIGYTGLNVRYSKDLVNWTVSSKSCIQGYWDEDFLAWEGFTASSDETVQNNTSYTASSWAPTVIKQNGLYYMYHGVNADVAHTSGTNWASSIVLAIASSPLGPFYPASYVSSYSGSDSNVNAIKTKLENLGVSYSQNFLVRYSAMSGKTRTANSSLDGNEIDNPDYSDSNNSRLGCIDPEFVFDIATGNLMEYTIGSNTCYAMIYGSWLYGIGLIYVDATSLKPVASAAFTLNDVSYEVGAELDMSLDEANLSQNSGSYGLLGTRIAGGYRAGYEGAQLFYNSETGYYYLITSCGGLDYEYRCTVSRSSSIDGEYVDAGGQSMLLTSSNASSYHSYGSKIIGSHVLYNEYSFRSQGGLSVLRDNNGKILFACHSRTNFQYGYYFYLQIHQMFFNEDGWPVLNQNEYYSDFSDYTADGTESLTKLSLDDIAGTYDTILTVRGSTSGTFTSGMNESATVASLEDAEPTESKTMKIASDGSISGSNYSGTVELASDGYSAVITLKDASGSELGTFKGYFMYALDWARKGSRVDRYTITFTSLSSTQTDAKAGEYFWGNKR